MLLGNNNKIKVFAFVGPWNKDDDYLKKKYNSNERIKIINYTSDFFKYLTESDIIITAGGMTTYEACACGIPGIVYSMSDNENTIVLLKKLSDIHLRAEISKKMQALVDGQGSIRIAKALIEKE